MYVKIFIQTVIVVANFTLGIHAMAQTDLDRYLGLLLDELGQPKPQVVQEIVLSPADSQSIQLTTEGSAEIIKQVLSFDPLLTHSIICTNSLNSFLMTYDLLVYRRQIFDQQGNILQLETVRDELTVRPVPTLGTSKNFAATFLDSSYLVSPILGMAAQFSEDGKSLVLSFRGSIEDYLIDSKTNEKVYQVMFFNDESVVNGILLDQKTGKFVTTLDCRIFLKS